jgi:hypothetical protein
MRKDAVISTGSYDQPRWYLGLYTPTRGIAGVKVRRGHFSAGIRGLIGFYVQSAVADPRERKLRKKKFDLMSGRRNRKLNDDERARVLGDAR